jgi:hypothetical protein
MVNLKAPSDEKSLSPIYRHKISNMSKQEEKQEQEQKQEKKQKEKQICDCDYDDEFQTEDELEEYRYQKWLARTEQREEKEGRYY